MHRKQNESFPLRMSKPHRWYIFINSSASLWFCGCGGSCNKEIGGIFLAFMGVTGSDGEADFTAGVCDGNLDCIQSRLGIAGISLDDLTAQKG